MHVRRFLIHVYHGRKDILLAHALFQKLKCPVEVFRHFRIMRHCKLRADRHQRIHKFHAVLSHTAPRHSDVVPDLLLVTPARRHQMIVLRNAALVDVRIAGILLLCPLVVGAQRLGCAALMLGKS